jgi:hypothetical protein
MPLAVTDAGLGLIPAAKLVQKVLEINTQSMEQLREVLF